MSLEDIRNATVTLIALVLSVAVHEFGHAIVADKLGDRTPRDQGRVTLNPLSHADPIGTFLFPLLGVLFFKGILFGWGRPVQVVPVNFTRKLRMKTAHLLVAAAGPAMNVILAIIVTGIYAVLLATGVLRIQDPIAEGVRMVILLNWILVIFNLLPIPPLDGGAVLAGLLPDRHQHIVEFLQQWGFMILIGLLVTGLVSYLLYPAIALTQWSLDLVARLVL